MWGNTKGWIIAGVELVVLCVVVWLVLGMVNDISEPTAWGKDPKRLKSLTLEVDPSSIVPTNGAGDATSLYRAVIDDVQRGQKKYETFNDRGMLPDAKGLPAIQSMLDATTMPKASILESRMAQNIGYFRDNMSPDLAALTLASASMSRVSALHYSAKNYPEAKRHYEALFSLGAKLYAERLGQSSAFAGLGMMGDAGAGLRQVALAQKDEKTVENLAAFNEARLEAANRIQEMWGVIASVGGTPVSSKRLATSAGDVFYFTGPEQKERMWRIESTLKLGQFKFNVGGKYGRIANQVGAQQRLAELAKDADPAVATAAKAALALTLGEFKMN
jgi:hypothetical protein